MVEIGNVFRGKTIGKGCFIVKHRWVIGFYSGPCGAKVVDGHWISEYKNPFGTPFLVDPATVGECTKLKDKNGEWIFEGDILKWDEREWGGKHYEIVTMDYQQLAYRKSDWAEWCEIISNIHDNPDLAREAENEDYYV